MKNKNMRTLLVLAPVVAFSLAGILGCDHHGDDVRQVREPKEQTTPAGSDNAALASMASEAAADQIQWNVPDGWKSLPADQMRFATFQVSDKDPKVQLTVIPLGMSSGSLAMNVNRWENQIGLPPTPEDKIPTVVKQIKTADGEAMDTVDLKAPAKDQNPALEMLAGILKHGGRTWFFKLAGPQEIVGPQKANFESFIQSIHFAEGAAMAGTPTTMPTGQLPGGQGMPGMEGQGQLPSGHPAVPGAQEGQQGQQLPSGHPAIPGQQPGQAAQPGQMPEMPGMDMGGAQSSAIKSYDAPAAWQKEPPRMMREVSFQIKSDNGDGEVIVTRLPGGTGGSFAMNVNRWRQQVGAPPIENPTDDMGEKVKIGGSDGKLLDFSGPKDAKPQMRQMVATLNKAGSLWFFKIIGPAELVEQQKQAFLKFLGSIQFAEGS